MKKLRVYLDTSVLGGAFDDEFAEASRNLIKYIKKRRLIPLISENLAAEIADAPLPVQELLKEISILDAELLYYSEAALDLHKEYLRAEVVPAKYTDDALHVALATIYRADVIASWNFKHLVNPTRIRAFNGVNLTRGYDLMIILTPADLVKLMETENE
ncbi:MAG: hypothetical protein V2A61_03485 [Calditrichota bacterium]